MLFVVPTPAVGLADTGSVEALQHCADRWNETRMAPFGSTPAFVSSHPRCAVEVPDSPIPNAAFHCSLDAYGAYECDNHAGPATVGLMHKLNATIKGATLTLDHPPRRPTPAHIPRWAAMYPITDGFVLPWDSNGRLRNGLTLKDHYRGTCWQGSNSTTAIGALTCYTRSLMNPVVADPCFPQTKKIGRGVLAACPTAPGSTTFVRFIVLSYLP